MSETAIAERVTLTREEYEVLRAGQPATVTVDAAEYAELVAFKAGNAKRAGEYTRLRARLTEVENMLRAEQIEHNKEINAMTARIKQLGG